MGGDRLEWPKYTKDEKNMLVFDLNMGEDSVIDGAEDWQPRLDFWLAIERLAQFKDPKETGEM